MARPSLDTILRLVEQVRQKKRGAKEVLHDALLDRYGEQYEVTLRRAHEYADRYGRTYYVRLDPEALTRADAQAEEQEKRLGRRPPFVLENMYAIWTVDSPQRTPPRFPYVTVVGVKPPPA